MATAPSSRAARAASAPASVVLPVPPFDAAIPTTRIVAPKAASVFFRIVTFRASAYPDTALALRMKRRPREVRDAGRNEHLGDGVRVPSPPTTTTKAASTRQRSGCFLIAVDTNGLIMPRRPTSAAVRPS